MSRTRVALSSALVAALLASSLVALLGQDSEPGATAIEPANAAQSDVTAEQRMLLERAELVLVNRCLQARGLRLPPSAAPEPGPSRSAESPYGITDVSWAREHGLGLRDSAASPRRAPAAPPSRREASRLVEALYGRPADPMVTATIPGGIPASASTRGCLAESQGRLYGDFRRWFRTRIVADNLASEVGPMVERDRRVRRALAAWRRCMRAAGVPAASPTDLRARFARRARGLAPAAAARAERAAAVTEARCGGRSRLARVGKRVEARSRDRVRRRHRRVVETYRALQIAAVRRARQLIVGGA